jgi:hypothetical protein
MAEREEPSMPLFKRRTIGKPGEWYYCLKHHKVEEGPECPAKDRFGPYPNRTEAEHAMEISAERNLQWENDPRWRDKFGSTEDDSD